MINDDGEENDESSESCKSFDSEYWRKKNKINIIDFLIIIIKCINFVKNTKIDASINLNRVLEYIQKIDKNKELNIFFIKIKENIFDKMQNPNELKQEFWKNSNFDRLSITFLFWKYKSGFSVDINAVGLTNLVNEIISQPRKQEKEEELIDIGEE